MGEGGISGLCYHLTLYLDYNLNFLQRLHFFYMLFFYVSSFSDHSALCLKEGIKLKFLVRMKYLKFFSKCIVITPCRTRVFWVALEVQKGARRGERWLQEREAFNKQNWGQHQAGEAWGVRRSSTDCSNDRKSNGHEKGQCLEDYYRRFFNWNFYLSDGVWLVTEINRRHDEEKPYWDFIQLT